MTALVVRPCLRAVTRVASLALFAMVACEHSSDPAQSHGRATDPTYLSACARCHGSDGRGGIAQPEGSHPPQNFHEAAFQSGRTDEQLKDVIRSGKGAMPAFGELFSDLELQGLVHQIRSFDPSQKKP
jgi:mono/diheme cytochrome c family protein